MLWSLFRSRAPAGEEWDGPFTKAHLLLGDRWLEIGIGNVSETGLIARCSRPLEVEAEVEIRRRGTVIRGKVVWVRGSRYGIASYHPIDVDALLAKSDLGYRPYRDRAPQSARLHYWHWRTPR